MVIQKLSEVDAARKGQQPGSSLTRSYAASMQRAPLLLQWRGDGSRDALSMSVPLGMAGKMGEAKIEARDNQP
jgi:hypothetical protein